MIALLLAALANPALALDQGPWQAVLDTYVGADGRVDYAGVAANHPLDGYLESLATAVDPADRTEKMVFWVNAYNALTVDLVADSLPIASIRDLDDGKVWDTRRFRVAKRDITLNEIEHQILRPLGDPRVHAALNCASLGCPPLSKTAFAAANLDAQLQDAARRWMSTNGISVDMAARKVKLNAIFDWYGGDFTGMNYKDIPGIAGKQEGAVHFAARYLPAEQAEWLKKGGYTVSYADYDWKLNIK